MIHLVIGEIFMRCEKVWSKLWSLIYVIGARTPTLSNPFNVWYFCPYEHTNYDVQGTQGFESADESLFPKHMLNLLT